MTTSVDNLTRLCSVLLETVNLADSEFVRLVRLVSKLSVGPPVFVLT